MQEIDHSVDGPISRSRLQIKDATGMSISQLNIDVGATITRL